MNRAGGGHWPPVAVTPGHALRTAATHSRPFHAGSGILYFEPEGDWLPVAASQGRALRTAAPLPFLRPLLAIFVFGV